MKISIVINTFNEEKNIERCLDSVKSFDDVVICDMYSTDATVEIAKRYGCRIVYFENCGICEPARNFAIQSAKNDWVLVLDADEVVTNDLILYLTNHIERSAKVKGLFIPRKNYFCGVFMECNYPDYQLRFLSKQHTDWPETIHARPRIEGLVKKIPKSRKELAIVHLDDRSIAQQLEKFDKYSEMEQTRNRQRNRQFSSLSILTKPLWVFLKDYLVKGGYKSGRMGYVYCKLSAIYSFMIIAKSWENSLTKRSKE